MFQFLNNAIKFHRQIVTILLLKPILYYTIKEGLYKVISEYNFQLLEFQSFNGANKRPSIYSLESRHLSLNSSTMRLNFAIK
jgi:hypothetical protein